MVMGAWKSIANVESMCIRQLVALEKQLERQLRVSRGNIGGYRGDWWWNGEVQGKWKQRS